MSVLTREEGASFTSNLLLAMRGHFQASNKDLADLLNNYAESQSISLEPPFTGGFLNNYRNPTRKTHPLTNNHLQVMYDLYLRHQLVPERESSWAGLIAVHRHLTGDDGLNLPPYLHDRGLAGWLHRQQLSKTGSHHDSNH